MYEALLVSTQFGFKANKSTNGAIFVVKNVIDNHQGELFCCFIDLKAAYDWIDLFKILEIRTRAITLVKLLECIYVGTPAAIKHSTLGREVLNLEYFQHLRINRKILDPGVLIKYAIPFTCSNRSQRREHPCSGEIRIIQVS